jgi:hypothetical protein
MAETFTSPNLTPLYPLNAVLNGQAKNQVEEMLEGLARAAAKKVTVYQEAMSYASLSLRQKAAEGAVCKGWLSCTLKRMSMGGIYVCDCLVLGEMFMMLLWFG